MSQSPVPSDAIVRFDAVHKAYHGSVAVERVDLVIKAGEFFTMLGPSGSGKTTSLRMLAGFERPDKGRIELAGRDVTGLAPFQRDINTVFQDYALFPHMSVAENIAYGLQAKKVPAAEQTSRIAEALRMVRLEALSGRRPGQLSGGQRQRVALARAIVNRPSVLLLDEPLGALDLKLRVEMQTELKRIQREVGITFVYVTHDQEEALTMSDRLAVFNQGRIEQIGTPAEVYEKPANAFVAGFVGTSSLIERGGRTLVLRPEKVHVLIDPAAPVPDGVVVETGVVIEAVYVGLFTRFVVELADGARVGAVRQNIDTVSADVGSFRGRPVRVGWRPEQVYSLPSSPS